MMSLLITCSTLGSLNLFIYALIAITILLDSAFEGSSFNGFRDMAATSGLTAAIVDLGHRTNLRVKPSTYIPNLKILAQRLTEIWDTSALTAAILAWGIGPIKGSNLVPTYIPNLTVLAQSGTEIWTTSGLTTAILDLGI